MPKRSKRIYISNLLGRLDQGTWLERSDLLDPFGRAMAKEAPEPEITGIRNPFLLDSSVGMTGENRRRDVAKVETVLGRSGHLNLAKTDGPTGYYGLRLKEAVEAFQKKHGLKKDGHLNPDGETINTLRTVIATKQENRKSDDNKKGNNGGSEQPVIPLQPGETGDVNMQTRPKVPGTKDQNEIGINDIYRLFPRKYWRI